MSSIKMDKIDKKLAKLGFIKVAEDEYGVAYLREGKDKNYSYDHIVALLHKSSGHHIIQSYDPALSDTLGIGNTAIGLTYEENMLFLKKMKKLKLHKA